MATSSKRDVRITYSRAREIALRIEPWGDKTRSRPAEPPIWSSPGAGLRATHSSRVD